MLRSPSSGLAVSRIIVATLAGVWLLAAAFGASPAAAEMQIVAYGGWNGSFDSDIHLVQPGGTNMTLKDVPWDGDSLCASLLGPSRNLLAQRGAELGPYDRLSPCQGDRRSGRGSRGVGNP
jgi:hypothetical protein